MKVTKRQIGIALEWGGAAAIVAGVWHGLGSSIAAAVAGIILLAAGENVLQKHR